MSEFINRLRTDPMRIAAIQYSQKSDDTMKVPQLLQNGGFNVEQLLHAVGNAGYGIYNKEKHNELIKAYIKDSTERGIDIILYENAHMLLKETYQEHKEWAQIEKNGNAAMAYDTYVFACVNSPWRNHFFENIKDCLEQDIKGIFLDGPLFIAEGCHCSHCRKLFSEQFGHSLETATHHELRQFKSKHIARFMKEVKEIIEQSGKDVVLYANSIGLAENITGCDLDVVFPYSDLIGSEGGFLFYGNPNEVSIWRGTECTKYLESKAQGKPYVVFDAGNHQPWARHMHTQAETTLLYAAVAANGGNVWYGIHGLIDCFDSPAGKAAFRFNQFLAENEAYFKNTKQYADIALLWSHNTINSFPEEVAETDFTKENKNAVSGAIGSFQKEFHGFSDILLRCHRQFSIIDETNVINGDLSKYKTLILPNTSCLDDKTLECICRFVENGGNLIATLASGMKDACGEAREHTPLHTLFGIKSVDEIVSYKPGCGYMTFEGEIPFVTDGSYKTIAGYSTDVLRCTYEDDAEILVSSYCPMEGRYAEFNEEKYPSVTVHHYGKGKAAYIAGGIGESYADYGILDMKAIVDGLVLNFTKSDIQVDNIYPSVEVEMRLQADKHIRLIHFVNHTGFMQRPIENFIECKGIQVALKTPSAVKRVRSLFYPCEIPFQQGNGQISFSVDVSDYELVVVELQN